MKKNSSSITPLVMLAAGGTGGHMFPAEALAHELRKRGLRVCLVTDQRGGHFSADFSAFPVYAVQASSLGKNFFAKVKGVTNMLLGTLQAWRLIRKLKPSLVVGFGGYPCVPPVFAASRVGIPILLHEQNAIAGRANKILKPLAKAIATSFPSVKGLENARTVLTGNPVRLGICALHEQPYPVAAENGQLKILVMGGSLGASVFGEVVPKAVKLLPENLRRRLVIAQQCRKADIDAVQHAYAESGMQPELATFFNDVPDRLAECHLVICRSGASTIAELAAAGRPSILVPYPHAVAGEQKANAEALADAGGAWLIPEQAFTPEALAVRLESLLNLPATLTKTAAAAKSLARLSATSQLADLACTLMGLSPGGDKEVYPMDETNQSMDSAAA
jgi:UDP-N-acetylglucosamine--N-acetylmuramyl-(pentapeptide) pyrophosphoryl-undecaprenol N-acetylglucosamine transferase